MSNSRLPKFSATRVAVEDEEVRTKIADVLGISPKGNWVISGTLDGTRVYLINPGDDSALKQYGWMKGIMVDISSNTIVGRSFGYTSMAVPNSIEEFYNTEGTVDVMDDLGNLRKIDLAATTFLQGFEGTIIRVGKYQGRKFVSTARTIDLTENSKWGNCEPFLQLFEKQGGNLDEEFLFPDGADTYNYVYIFMISAKQLYTATKCPVPEESSGFNVYLGIQVLWKIEDPPYAKYKGETDASGKLKPYVGSLSSLYREFDTTPSVIEACMERKFLVPPVLKGSAAYGFLKYGYHNVQLQPLDSITDERLVPGEFLLANYFNSEGVYETLKIASPGYMWRWNMSGQNPKAEYGLFMQREVLKLNLKTQQDVVDDYLPKYPIIDVPKGTQVDKLIESLELQVPFDTLSNTDDYTIILDPRDRMINVWLAYIVSLPPSRQLDGLRAFKEMEEDIEAAVTFFSQVALEKLDPEETLRITARRIVRDARNKLQDWNMKEGGRKKPQEREAKVRSIFQFIFSKMLSVDLYSVISDMKSYYKLIKAREKKELSKPKPEPKTLQDILQNYEAEFPKLSSTMPSE